MENTVTLADSAQKLTLTGDEAIIAIDGRNIKIPLSVMKTYLGIAATGNIVPAPVPGLNLGSPVDAQVYFGGAGEYILKGVVTPVSDPINIFFWDKVAWKVLGVEMDVFAKSEELNKVKADFNGVSLSLSDLVIGGIGENEGQDSEAAGNSRTEYLPIPERAKSLTYSLLVLSSGSSHIFFYDANKVLISAYIRFNKTPTVAEERAGELAIPEGSAFVRAKTINESSPYYVPFSFKFKIEGLVDETEANKSDIEYINGKIENLLSLEASVQGADIPLSDLVIGGIGESQGQDSSNTGNSRTEYIPARAGFPINYSLLVLSSGTSHIFFYDKNKVLTGLFVRFNESPTFAKEISGSVLPPENTAFVRAKTISESSPYFVPYTFKFEVEGAIDAVESLSDEVELLKLGSNSYMDMLSASAKSYTRTKGVNGGDLKFCMLHFTDVHLENIMSTENLNEFIEFSKHPLIKNELQFSFFTGDATNGRVGISKATTVATLERFKDSILNLDIPTAVCVGNHDDNVSWDTQGTETTAVSGAIKKPEQYQLLIKPTSDKWPNIHTYLNKSYSYVDFADFKIRIISIDSYELPYTDKGDGSLKYARMGKYYSQTQLNWLHDVLQATPSDYAVIIGHHGTIRSGFYLGRYVQGVDTLPDIVNAWKNATSHTHSFTSAEFPELNTSKVFDFTARGEGEFVCYLSGHTHGLALVTNTKYEDQNIITGACLSMRNSGATGSGEYDSGGAPLLVRGDNNELRNSFNFISIDRGLKMITVVTYGAHRDAYGLIRDRVNFVTY